MRARQSIAGLLFTIFFMAATNMRATRPPRTDTTLHVIASMAQPDRVNSTPPRPDLTFKSDERNVFERFTKGNFISQEYQNTITPNENFRRARRGIIITGKGKELRAMSPFGGSVTMGHAYADAVNKYKSMFGRNVNVYCMVIPTAAEYYCPNEARQYTQCEFSAINSIYAHLSDSVKAVDVYSILGKHANENIYLRTDHHWGALGAYYAAQEFAQVAEVPFRSIENYDSMTIRNFVGTMHNFSRDNAVKRAAEDFIYYVPRDVEYTTTYTEYRLNSKRQAIGERNPKQGPFFRSYPDGSPVAYCTFIGGDTNTTKVKTSTKNGRRLLILKDSFGNALPGYLFYSFEEINIVDYRYFLQNIVTYVNENNITDILFANNNAHAHAKSTSEAYMKFLKR
jgi:hypothetical protein